MINPTFSPSLKHGRLDYNSTSETAVQNKKKITDQGEGYTIQLMPWLFISLVLCYTLFFLFPALFNANHTFSPFNIFPRLNPIGIDLQYNLDFSQAWLKNGSPYVGSNYYPPLETVFFAPLTVLTFSSAYKIVSIFSLLSYLFIFMLFLKFKNESLFQSGWSVAILFVSLFSYGVLFELERGQYDLIAMAACILATYLFHFKHRYRLLAYMLFCIAVQLKVYPLIFIIVFIDYAQPISSHIKRWGGLLLANVLLLFSLGLRPFIDFSEAMLSQIKHPTYAWLGNHSINSFLTIPSDELDRYNPYLFQFVNKYGNIMQFIFLTLVFAFILFLVIYTYKRHLPPYNPFLLLGCTLGCMLIPSTSHDYKLSLLAPVATYLFLRLSEIELHDKKTALLTNLVAGFFSLLFSIYPYPSFITGHSGFKIASLSYF
jgi:hypothetical protein